MFFQGLHLHCYQPHLEVFDVISNIKDLQLNSLQDVGFFNVDNLRESFIKVLQEGTKHAGLLIVLSANSAAILLGKIQVSKSSPRK